MLAAFFLGGVLSFGLSIPFFAPDATFVGASAAIFTLTAVVMLLKPLRFSLLLLMPVGLVAVLYFLYNTASRILQSPKQCGVRFTYHRFCNRTATRNRLESNVEKELANLIRTPNSILRLTLSTHNIRTPPSRNRLMTSNH